ncbi:MAG: GGDEF domain-containing protein, partial [Gammaproteobacteria bacterium]|nr:GGDEF domain-containing protein [Gammaproteobacteria bacterium]
SVDLISGGHYSSPLVPIWNMMVRLAFFVIILWLLLIVREKLALEESLADTDPLTGLANRRFFQEQLDREFNRLRRYPEAITIAYLDLDNFKYVNDTLGHDVGDELLKIVADSLSRNTRDSDYVSRQGGDEFAILFPLLEGEAVAGIFAKLQKELLREMQERAWPVTFSIGAVTFTQVMDSSRDMLKRVDDLMYEVKKSGKNNIRHITWPDDSIIKRLQYASSSARDKISTNQKKPS